MRLNRIIVSLLAASLASSVVANTFNEAQVAEIESIVHSYLVQHPEVLLEASQALQAKQQKNLQAQTQEAILKNVAPIFSSKYTTVGNLKGKVTLVEFFDYECIHCKKMAPVIDSLLKKNPDLKVVYQEFPIFGKVSEYASAAAIAAGMQGKYKIMHDKLISQNKKLTEDLIDNLAKESKLDMNKYKNDINSSIVKNEILNIRQLAEKLHLMGTPAVIVAATPINGILKKGNLPVFIPGAATETSLEELIVTASN